MAGRSQEKPGHDFRCSDLTGIRSKQELCLAVLLVTGDILGTAERDSAVSWVSCSLPLSCFGSSAAFMFDASRRRSIGLTGPSRTERPHGLADAGFDVMEAPDAEHAFRLRHGAPLEVKLLFTDVRLPGAIDGLEFAREVHDRWPQMGIIMASGKAVPQPHELPAGTRFHRNPYDAAAVVRHAHELTRA